MEYHIFTLSNGIRVIHQHTNSKVAHCGMIINTGSRDENSSELGMAHFVEHVLFKGTKKRKAYHIISRLEDVGGEIDAYTTKEEICIYASFLCTHFERTIELLSDILFHSTFPDKELKKEKDVIIDEINSYKDSPAELIFDDFEDMVYAGHPLGKNILGTPKMLKKYGKKQIIQFIEKTFNTDEMVFSSVGNIEINKLKKLIEKYFGAIPANYRNFKREIFQNYIPLSKNVHKDTHQSHCLIGNIAYDLNNEKRIALSLLNNLLAGPGMNSRLNMILREKHGLVYNVESSYSAYSDTGIINIYFGTDKHDLDKSIDLVMLELKKLRDQKLGTLQLSKAKQQMIGQIAISQDSNETTMLTLGKSLLIFNKVDSEEDTYRKIQSITASNLLEAANEIFAPQQLSMLIYK